MMNSKNMKLALSVLAALTLNACGASPCDHYSDFWYACPKAASGSAPSYCAADVDRACTEAEMRAVELFAQCLTRGLAPDPGVMQCEIKGESCLFFLDSVNAVCRSVFVR